MRNHVSDNNHFNNYKIAAATTYTWLALAVPALFFKFYLFIYSAVLGLATPSSVLAWRIPGAGEPGGLLSMGSHRVGLDWSDLAAAAAAAGLTWRRRWHPTPVLLPGKSHGRRSLEGCSPWGFEESDMTERLHFHFSLSCAGEGNGNPLQCSCLENPRDKGTWWAAFYGVTQSWTRLKRLSSSSSSRSYLPHMGSLTFTVHVEPWVTACGK